MTGTYYEAHTTPASAGLLILRFGVGIVMTVHGFQKIFQLGVGQLAEMWTGMVPLAQIAAPIVSIVEFAGGIALILGVLTRVAAALLAMDMLGAIFIVHLPNGFYVPDGYEFTLALFTAMACLTLTGAGAYSVDALMGGRRAEA